MVEAMVSQDLSHLRGASPAWRAIGQVRRYVLCPIRRGEGVRGGSADPLGGLVEVHLPEPNRVVGAAAGQGVPVWAERHRVDVVGMAGQG